MQQNIKCGKLWSVARIRLHSHLTLLKRVTMCAGKGASARRARGAINCFASKERIAVACFAQQTHGKREPTMARTKKRFWRFFGAFAERREGHSCESGKMRGAWKCDPTTLSCDPGLRLGSGQNRTFYFGLERGRWRLNPRRSLLLYVI